MQCQLVTVEDLNMFAYRANINYEGVRPYRWSIESQSKYIESLLLKLPVTPIYLSEELHEEDDGYSYGESQVIDGVPVSYTHLTLPTTPYV